MVLKNSTLFFCSSLIAGSLLTAPVAKNIEQLLTNHHKELGRIIYESNKKNILAYEHPNFTGLFFDTSKNLYYLAEQAFANPLNYLPTMGLFIGFYMKRKEGKISKNPPRDPYKPL